MWIHVTRGQRHPYIKKYRTQWKMYWTAPHRIAYTNKSNTSPRRTAYVREKKMKNFKEIFFFNCNLSTQPIGYFLVWNRIRQDEFDQIVSLCIIWNFILTPLCYEFVLPFFASYGFFFNTNMFFFLLCLLCDVYITGRVIEFNLKVFFFIEIIELWRLCIEIRE